ncbi:MAG TPA: tetratricopeptide repeat protein [Candidatus Polarisedimenticolia bacterium]|nr:tetratricopeptide repeat protein [Candidatus Polarisedimenticolia bacterium]
MPRLLLPACALLVCLSEAACSGVPSGPGAPTGHAVPVAPASSTPTRGAGAAAAGDGADYADPGVCLQCHAAIAESYRSVAMAQSFRRAEAGEVIEDFERDNRLKHAASGYTYEMRREGTRLIQRRYETDAAGRRVRVFEQEATFIIGSGRHARSYLHRAPTGELTQMPVTWYTQEGRWGMSPGYDRRDQRDFFRPVTYACLFCHNAYPAVPSGADSPIGVSLFPENLPSGIDCQRCHGPGARHVALARRSDAGVEEVRGAILNPARLSPERRMDVCQQCHLETTATANWNSVLVLGRGVFSFRPGEDLAAYRRHFDYPPGGAGGEDRFEIAHQAYRLRQSVCFRKSNGRLTCTTCHDPHRRPDDPAAFFSAKCLDCHEREDCRGMHGGGSPGGQGAARSRGTGGRGTCVDCHMPKRRTEDVIHVTMTDHLIRRRPPPAAVLLAPRHEVEGLYRGAIAPYRPEEFKSAAERGLYLGLASLIDEVDPANGVTLLSKGLASERPEAPEPYFQLGVALLDQNRAPEALEALRRAAALAPDNPRLLLALGNAEGAAGRPEAALTAYDAAISAWPSDSEAQTNAGNLLLRTGRTREALERYDRAIALRGDNAEAHGNRGALLGRLGRAGEASDELREALRIDPSQAEASSNLASLLLDRGEEAEGLRILKEGVARTPRHAGLLSRLSFVLATSPRDAVRSGEEALRLAGQAVRITSRRDARALDALAAALAETGRPAEAARVAAEGARLAATLGQGDLASAIQERLRIYESGRPYRTGAPGRRGAGRAEPAGGEG